MNDRELVTALQAVFDADDPADGIDRHGGYGSDYRIESLRIVPSDDGFKDLEVTVKAGQQTIVSRVLFDRGWREANGFDDVRSFATYVVAAWHGSQFDDTADEAAVPQAVPSVEKLWTMLETSLASDFTSLHRVRHGVTEMLDEDGEIVTLHLTPQQWRAMVSRSEKIAAVDSGEDAWRSGDGPIIELGNLDELIATREDDENHIVYFRGQLCSSVRAELPPVGSILRRERLQLSAGGEWFAYAPLRRT